MTTTVTGTSGDDTLLAADGTKFIGGNGTDTLVFAGNIAEYMIGDVHLANLKTTVTNTVDGTVDDVRLVEWFEFADAFYNVATGGIEWKEEPEPEPVNVSVDVNFDAVLEGGNYTVTFTRGGDLSAPLTVNYTVNDSEHSITFNANEASFSFIELAPDDLFFGMTPDPIEYVVVDGEGYVGGGSSAMVTFLDNDLFVPTPLPVISVTAPNSVPNAPPPGQATGVGASVTLTEGDALTLTFHRDGDLTQELSFDFTVDTALFGSALMDDGNASTPGDDFTTDYTGAWSAQPAPFPPNTFNHRGTLTFAADSDTATLTMTTYTDLVDEGGTAGESFAISLVPSDFSSPTYNLDTSQPTISVTLLDA